MGWGGGFSKAFKSVKKVASKAFSKPNKIVSNVISKVPGGTSIEKFLQGKGTLGSLEKYLDPGSSLVKNFTNDPENFLKNWGGYKDDLGKVWTGIEGIKMMFNPPKPPDPVEPPKPDAPDLSNTWSEYTNWMNQAKTTRDNDISTARARLYEAGATPDMITAHETDLRSQYDASVQKFQSGANYRMLQEGFDIARGARENPYAQALKGYTKGQNLNEYFTANYSPANPVEDPNAAMFRAKNAAAGGSLVGIKPGRPGFQVGLPPQISKRTVAPAPAKAAGGGGGPGAMADYSLDPGQNPWMVS
jgi:hypothetical protein